MELSGPAWVPRFPNSRSVDDLSVGFRDKVKSFIAALTAAGATVSIADTLRPAERAYLMHFSFLIADGLSTASVPAKAGVDIQWTHPDAPGKPGAQASKDAAAKMVAGYGIVFKPALNSRHTDGNAIDMSISWIGDLVIKKADGTSVTITSAPRDGGNGSLHKVGESYGVIKLTTDPPHWSTDGH